MGEYQFRLPDIGEGVVEGEIVTWHIEQGSTVTEDDPLVEVMTDKATVTIPSPVTGEVSMTKGKVGEIIPVGQVFIVFQVEGDGNTAENTGSNELDNGDSKTGSSETTVEVNETVEAKTTVVSEQKLPVLGTAAATQTSSRSISGKALASPAVRQRAKLAGIDLKGVQGSGPAGRISHGDLDAHLAGASSYGESTSQSGARVSHSLPIGVERNGTTDHPVVGLRRKIAEKMVMSKTNIPHFSYFEEVDVTELESLRQTLNASKTADQPKLTYLPFIMLALARAMPSHPECNAIHDEAANKVIRHDAVNIGIATSTDRGLYVPVVKHVEAMGIWAAAAEMIRVSGAARSGSIEMAELAGSTFTITSLGRDGGLGATPIINHPEVAILGVHSAVERPVVRAGNIVIRRMMNLSSSFDHRVVDGSDGAALVQSVKRLLEHPALIFM